MFAYAIIHFIFVTGLANYKLNSFSMYAVCVCISTVLCITVGIS